MLVFAMLILILREIKSREDTRSQSHTWKIYRWILLEERRADRRGTDIFLNIYAK